MITIENKGLKILVAFGRPFLPIRYPQIKFHRIFHDSIQLTFENYWKLQIEVSKFFTEWNKTSMRRSKYINFYWDFFYLAEYSRLDGTRRFYLYGRFLLLYKIRLIYKSYYRENWKKKLKFRNSENSHRNPYISLMKDIKGISLA